MSYTLEELTTPLTKAEIEASIYAVVAQVGSKHTSWKPGAIPRTMITASAILLAALSRLVSLIAGMAYLDKASGSWLKVVAKYGYGYTAREATFAEGPVTLDNSAGAGDYTFDPYEVTFANPGGHEFKNTTGFTLAPGATLEGLQIIASVAGAGSTSAVGAITSIVSPTMTGCTVTNTAPLVGLEAEEDPEIRVNARNAIGAVSPNGPWDAYDVAAKAARRATNGSLVGVTRVRHFADSYGNVDVYVADASGGISGVYTDPNTDLGAVQTYIERYAEPNAVTATAKTGTGVTVNITAELWVYDVPGLPGTDAQIVTEATAAIATLFSRTPIGGVVVGSNQGKLFREAIRKAISGLYSETFDVQLTTPATDLLLAVNEFPEVGTVAVVVHRVPPQGGLS